jgi:hypothetical protein
MQQAAFDGLKRGRQTHRVALCKNRVCRLAAFFEDIMCRRLGTLTLGDTK